MAERTRVLLKLECPKYNLEFVEYDIEHHVRLVGGKMPYKIISKSVYEIPENTCEKCKFFEPPDVCLKNEGYYKGVDVTESYCSDFTTT